MGILILNQYLQMDNKADFPPEAEGKSSKCCLYGGIITVCVLILTFVIILIAVLAGGEGDCPWAEGKQWQPDGSCGNYKYVTTEADTVDNYDQLVDDLIANNKIMIFAKTDCPYSEKLRNLFNENGGLKGQYKLVEIDLEPKGSILESSMKKETKQKSVPNLFIGGKHIGGFDETNALAESGKLKKILDDLEIENDFE